MGRTDRAVGGGYQQLFEITNLCIIHEAHSSISLIYLNAIDNIIIKTHFIFKRLGSIHANKN
jgi:hypothetical protein